MIQNVFHSILDTSGKKQTVFQKYILKEKKKYNIFVKT